MEQEKPVLEVRAPTTGPQTCVATGQQRLFASFLLHCSVISHELPGALHHLKQLSKIWLGTNMSFSLDLIT